MNRDPHIANVPTLDIFDKWVQENLISQSGADFVRHALDPFHDYNKEYAGYPDVDGSRTVVAKFQITTQVTKPVGALAEWDLHAFNLPFVPATAHTFDTGNVQSNGARFLLTNPRETFGGLGFLNIVKTDAGQPLFFDSVPFAPTNWTCTDATDAALRDALMTGRSRIVAMGMEVIDTTAELNKQGAITVYRMPNTACQAGNLQVYNAVAPGHWWQGNYAITTAPPSTTSEASLLGGTRQWEAKKGAYVTCAMTSVNNPLDLPAQQGLLVDPNPQAANHDAVLAGFGYLTGTDASNQGLSGQTYGKAIPWGTTGAMLTGLANSASIRIIWHVYVESAPTFTNPLCRLATSSAALDEIALKAYSLIVNEMPPGVEVNENAFGKWFRRIKKVATSIIPRLTPYADKIPQFAVIKDAIQSNKALAKAAIRDTKAAVNQLKQIKKKA